jgi:hypothetical protein
MMKMDRPCALVTGAGRGLGRASAEHSSRAGGGVLPPPVTFRHPRNERHRARLSWGVEVRTGLIDPIDFRKRVAAIVAERNTLTLQMEALEPPEIDESARVDVAYAFARWSRLGRARRRRLLKSFGVRFWIEKNGKGFHACARVTRIEIGVLSNAVVYN